MHVVPHSKLCALIIMPLHSASQVDMAEGLHAMQESEVQAEYDNILREAKLLRMDLQHALTKCLEHRVCTTHCCIDFMHN